MKKYYLLFFIVLTVFVSFSCNQSNETSVTDIEVDSSLTTAPVVSWITDESDIVMPNKRSLNLKADAFSMGLKGNVKKLEERHYKADMVDGMMHVSTDLANTSIYENGSNDCPNNENHLLEGNQDIYFDHDGFIIKHIYYNNSGVKSIYYSKYDDNGNHLETNIQDEKGLRRSLSSSFFEYSTDKYKPYPKNEMELSSDGTITTYYTYDNMKNVILEIKRDNINGVFPYLYICKYLYQYDEKGNWINRTYLLKDTKRNSPFIPMGVARRTIYYW